MIETTLGFLSLLFDKDETVCVSPNKYGYHSISQNDMNEAITLISPKEGVNPMFISEKSINLIAVNPIKGWRRDSNVTKFRSFMVEIDTGTLEDQKKYIEESKLPYSACVFSGNKSLHFAITLDEALPNIDMWRFYNKWIMNILTETDQQILNPSRSIRFPGNKRHDGKQLTQSLVSLKSRISQEDFFRWLFEHEDKKPVQKRERYESPYTDIASLDRVPKSVHNMVGSGVLDNRNATWFYIGCCFAEAGFSLEATIGYLMGAFQEENDFKRQEWEGCLKSAYKRINK